MNTSCPVCRDRGVEFFHKKDGYTYYYCKMCDLVFLDPIPSSKKVHDLYDDHYEFRVNLNAESRFKMQAVRILKRIKTISPKAKTLLDIGTGYGTFVKVAENAGFDALGLEPADNLYKASKNHTKNVLKTGFEGYFKKNKHKKFDVITMIHVVEHLHDPHESLKAILKHLTPNGILFIETPNVDSHLFYAEKENYTFLTPPDHIHLFSPKSLTVLLHEINSALKLTTDTYSYAEHLMGILKKRLKGSLKVSEVSPTKKTSMKSSPVAESHPPFIDTRIAPVITPLLNLGHKGSILQMYIKKVVVE